MKDKINNYCDVCISIEIKYLFVSFGISHKGPSLFNLKKNKQASQGMMQFFIIKIMVTATLYFNWKHAKISCLVSTKIHIVFKFFHIAFDDFSFYTFHIIQMICSSTRFDIWSEYHGRHETNGSYMTLISGATLRISSHILSQIQSTLLPLYRLYKIFFMGLRNIQMYQSEWDFFLFNFS